MKGAGAGSQDRGTKRTRDESDDTSDGTTNIYVEVTTGEGVTVKLQLPPTATVWMVKQEVESKLGIRPRDACVFSIDEAHTEKLQDEETLDSMLVGKEAKLELLLLIEQADAQQVVPELSVAPSMVLGDGTAGNGDTQLNCPSGVAFIAAHPDWLVTTEQSGHRIKISNIRTGALVCKFGEMGSGEGEFRYPMGVAVTSNSSFVIVADYLSYRVQVLRLVVGADSISAHLEYVRSIGSGGGNAEGQLGGSSAVALLQSNGGQETVLVAEASNHRVSQFALDGTFIGIFAGTGEEESSDGDFTCPQGIAVLSSSGEVAVADNFNHRVQIFDNEGKYKRQFGNEGKEENGQLFHPSGITSDAHGNLLVTDWTNRLQVFDPEGKHLCTRSDLGLHGDSSRSISWSADGEIAVTDSSANKVSVWHSA
jgi:DNA-binding beta-propeller fold protein YncE